MAGRLCVVVVVALRITLVVALIVALVAFRGLRVVALVVALIVALGALGVGLRVALCVALRVGLALAAAAGATLVQHEGWVRAALADARPVLARLLVVVGILAAACSYSLGYFLNHLDGSNVSNGKLI